MASISQLLSMPIQKQMAAMIAKIATTIAKAKPKLRLLVTTAEERAPYTITPIRMNTAVKQYVDLVTFSIYLNIVNIII